MPVGQSGRGEKGGYAHSPPSLSRRGWRESLHTHLPLLPVGGSITPLPAPLPPEGHSLPFPNTPPRTTSFLSSPNLSSSLYRLFLRRLVALMRPEVAAATGASGARGRPSLPCAPTEGAGQTSVLSGACGCSVLSAGGEVSAFFPSAVPSQGLVCWDPKSGATHPLSSSSGRPLILENL